MKTNTLAHAELEHWWHKSRRKIITDVFWRLYENEYKPRILSVGASHGSELAYLSQYGDVTGIDVCDKALADCRKSGFQVEKADITSCKFPDESFDVVFAMDVLEHIPDHKKAYAEIFRLLKPGGHVVITVPACPFLWSAFDEMGDFPHQRRYTRRSLLALLRDENFAFSIVSYFNFFLFPLIAITRKLPIKPSSHITVPPKVVNKIFEAIFSFERFVLRFMRFPIGVSLLAIGCKPGKK